MQTRSNGIAVYNDIEDGGIAVPRCVICWQRPRNLMLYPCGHLCVCQQCWDVYYVEHIREQGTVDNVAIRCPFCNQLVSDTVQIKTE